MFNLASGVTLNRSGSRSCGAGDGEGSGVGVGSGVGAGEGSGVGVGSGVGAGDGLGEGVVVVSTVNVTELLASEPSALLLSAESEHFQLATEITPSVVLSAVGVKVAV